MRQSFRIASLVLVSLLALSFNSLKAQLKIGGNPYTISPASILELESDRQGLLLPRLSSFTQIDALTPPNGMMVYYTGTNPGIYLKTASGWEKLASSAESAANWGLTGNDAVTPAHFIGSINAADVIFKSNASERFRITSDGKLKIQYADMTANTSSVEVLVLNTDGSGVSTIEKRSLDPSAFGAAVKSLNSLNGDLTINTDVATTNETLEITDDGTSALTIKAPIMDGTGTKTYGFMSKGDYDKLQNLTGGTAFETLTYVAATDDHGATISFDNVTGKYQLKLHAADATYPGIVTTTTQTFAGDKTFSGATTLSGDVYLDGTNIYATGLGAGTTTDNNVLVLDGSSSFKYRTLAASAFDGAITSVNGLTDNAITLALGTAGNDLAFSAATGTVTLDVPDASATARGVITTGAQEIAGAKQFKDKSSANAGFVVGAPVGTQTSTFTVTGSVAMSIRTATGTYTVAATDYTILVKPTADATITLPDATTNIGRVINVKRLSGNPDLSADAFVVTIDTAGGDIDGAAASITAPNNTNYVFQSDGTNWYKVN